MCLDNRGGHQWSKEHSEVGEQALRKHVAENSRAREELV